MEKIHVLVFKSTWDEDCIWSETMLLIDRLLPTDLNLVCFCSRDTSIEQSPVISCSLHFCPDDTKRVIKGLGFTHNKTEETNTRHKFILLGYWRFIPCSFEGSILEILVLVSDSRERCVQTLLVAAVLTQPEGAQKETGARCMSL